MMQDGLHQSTCGKRIVSSLKLCLTTSTHHLLRRARNQCLMALHRVSRSIADLGITMTVCTAAQRPINEMVDKVFGWRERLTRLCMLDSRSDERGVLRDLSGVGHLPTLWKLDLENGRWTRYTTTNEEPRKDALPGGAFPRPNRTWYPSQRKPQASMARRGLAMPLNSSCPDWDDIRPVPDGSFSGGHCTERMD